MLIAETSTTGLLILIRDYDKIKTPGVLPETPRHRHKKSGASPTPPLIDNQIMTTFSRVAMTDNDYMPDNRKNDSLSDQV